MNPDLTVIRRQGRYSVLQHSQPVRLRDGTVVDLHLVQQGSGHHDDRFLRAVLDHPLVESHVVDVRDLAKTLDADIRKLPERDAGDVVVIELRQLYPDGAGLLTKIVEESLAKLPAANHFTQGGAGQADMFDQPADRRFWVSEAGEETKLTREEVEALNRFVTAAPERLRAPLYSRAKQA